MLAYATIGALDMAASITFYDAVLGALGASRCHDGDDFVGYRVGDESQPVLWICHPYDKQPARPGNGVMVGLQAPSRAAVDAFHAAALAHGGTSEGEPGLRDYGPSIYLAYVRDPVGNKLSAVCHAPL
jgi:catechol 2,3-dioxygenase-like lactoylglutathione lyase family enzyme